MKKIISFISLFFILISSTTFAATELSEDVKDALQQKKLFVLEGLNLTNDQEIAFLPVYNDYQIDKAALNGKMISIIEEFAENYNALTNVKAGQLLDNWLASEQVILDLKKNYVVKFEKVITRKDVMRYYQIENKLDVLVKYELIKAVPLAK